MTLNYNEVKSYLYNAGFRGPDLESAIRIAECESAFNTNAHNTEGEDSRGLMQINLNAHPEFLIYDLFDPQINTNIAYGLYSLAGNSFKDWTCARSLGLVNGEIPLYLALAIGIVIVLYSLS